MLTWTRPARGTGPACLNFARLTCVRGPSVGAVCTLMVRAVLGQSCGGTCGVIETSHAQGGSWRCSTDTVPPSPETLVQALGRPAQEFTKADTGYIEDNDLDAQPSLRRRRWSAQDP